MSTERWPDYQPRYVRPGTKAETKDIGVALSEHNFDWRYQQPGQPDEPGQQDPRQQLQPPTQLHQSPSRHYYQGQYNHRADTQLNEQPSYRHDVAAADRFQTAPLSRLSRLSRLSGISRGSRMSRLSRNAAPDCVVVECFLRVLSACIASAVIAVSAIIYVLVAPTFTSNFNTTSVDHLSWAIGIPIGGTALTWQLIRLGILATGFLDDRTEALSMPLLVADIVVEAVLAVGSVICSILAGFQAARHFRLQKREAGCEIALSVLLGMLAVASFGVLTMAFVEEHRRRSRTRAFSFTLGKETRDTNKKERRRFRHSSNSSVIEIIRQ
ncbi:hypothetical protein F503_01386 [Ophiostoma piceae UAMH 11346]|uniref:Uncharacterized protein n=1 Tax=Ophiostoma piceae (strain UAMH 11346) TaxID=1262450 RepID=S3BV41_OPHP1|nr:hypothetical protein F503_01386 [Ophiostoma piceae UAMH 11346]